MVGCRDGVIMAEAMCGSNPWLLRLSMVVVPCVRVLSPFALGSGAWTWRLLMRTKHRLEDDVVIGVPNILAPVLLCQLLTWSLLIRVKVVKLVLPPVLRRSLSVQMVLTTTLLFRNRGSSVKAIVPFPGKFFRARYNAMIGTCTTKFNYVYALSSRIVWSLLCTSISGKVIIIQMKDPQLDADELRDKIVWDLFCSRQRQAGPDSRTFWIFEGTQLSWWSMRLIPYLFAGAALLPARCY